MIGGFYVEIQSFDMPSGSRSGDRPVTSCVAATPFDCDRRADPGLVIADLHTLTKIPNRIGIVHVPSGCVLVGVTKAPGTWKEAERLCLSMSNYVDAKKSRETHNPARAAEMYDDALWRNGY